MADKHTLRATERIQTSWVGVRVNGQLNTETYELKYPANNGPS